VFEEKTLKFNDPLDSILTTRTNSTFLLSCHDKYSLVLLIVSVPGKREEENSIDHLRAFVEFCNKI
jgi:hypothetical protein